MAEINPDIPSEEELIHWKEIKYWQEILNLQDWDVRVKIVSQKVLGDEVDANIMPIAEHKRALLKLLSKEAMATDMKQPNYIKAFDYGYDFLYVHELLHLKFWFEDFQGRDIELFEQSINDLTQTIIAQHKTSNEQFLAITQRCEKFADKNIQLEHMITRLKSRLIVAEKDQPTESVWGYKVPFKVGIDPAKPGADHSAMHVITKEEFQKQKMIDSQAMTIDNFKKKYGYLPYDGRYDLDPDPEKDGGIELADAIAKKLNREEDKPHIGDTKDPARGMMDPLPMEHDDHRLGEGGIANGQEEEVSDNPGPTNKVDADKGRLRPSEPTSQGG